MKANNGTGNNESRDLWETKDDLFSLLNAQYAFCFDCCANEKNRKTLYFSSDFEKEKDLDGFMCWMNPPFSKATAMFKHFFKVVEEGVSIYRCDNMETKVWQEIIFKNADWVFIPKGRVSYKTFDIKIMGGSCRFPSALIGVGVDPPKLIGGSLLRVEA